MRVRRNYVKYGTQRTRRGFLWLPLHIHGETRWLEKATWVEEFDAIHDEHGWIGKWVPIRWESP
jgi:hypothetical protein